MFGDQIRAGALVLYLTHMGKLFSHIAKEVAPGTETLSKSVGKGLTTGVKEGLQS